MKNILILSITFLQLCLCNPVMADWITDPDFPNGDARPNNLKFSEQRQTTLKNTYVSRVQALLSNQPSHQGYLQLALGMGLDALTPANERSLCCRLYDVDSSLYFSTFSGLTDPSNPAYNYYSPTHGGGFCQLSENCTDHSCSVSVGVGQIGCCSSCDELLARFPAPQQNNVPAPQQLVPAIVPPMP